ncbi:TylF/MycF family methyltransferase [Antrihabitans sp. YC2-6]|uniref:TylF/MycF family methyltransferase n=1 Tax=Antrihabitans sp. YC2-6 TaxID=2799498 RepID=UPI0018F4363C|nr:TylF/MycF family methyltransferase [Antrihabitans sp. YC2-6]MBJ8348314.1 TylF/MycF family methyltransferase [Antrihabitans sp. YC2-6]
MQSIENSGTIVQKNVEDHLRSRYIDLLSNTLTMALWNAADGHTTPRLALKRLGPEAREDGRDWPALAHTMIGRARLKSLRSCVERVLADNVPGDFIETGVWRGGACIFMRGMLDAHGIRDRRVWVADSFQGLPRPDRKKYPADAGDLLYRFKQLAISRSQVEENFRRYGLLDDQVVFLEGYFRDTLPTAPIEQLAIVRLDGDMYESTMDGLTNLYSKLSVGGYLIVDDYGLSRCRRAVDEFRATNGISERIETIDWTGAYWRKTATR